jgi:hypothetical protein
VLKRIYGRLSEVVPAAEGHIEFYLTSLKSYPHDAVAILIHKFRSAVNVVQQGICASKLLQHMQGATASFYLIQD